MANERNSMERIKYDVKNISLVEIDKIRPNNWNPKDKETEEYKLTHKPMETSCRKTDDAPNTG